MANAIDRLLDIAGPPLGQSAPTLKEYIASSAGPLLDDLLQMLWRKNGFYAFESALHAFPSGRLATEIDLASWNSKTLWRDSYGDLTEGCFFFAEDTFGGQFCIKDDLVQTFDPETGALEAIAGSIDEWAAAILADYKVLTGYPILHRWQEKSGPIPPRKRLVPRIPFVAGGEYGIENLQLLDSVRGMQLRGEIALQIKDLPDGTQIRLRIVE